MDAINEAMRMLFHLVKEQTEVAITITKKGNSNEVTLAVETDIPREAEVIYSSIVTGMLVNALVEFEADVLIPSLLGKSGAAGALYEFAEITAEKIREDLMDRLHGAEAKMESEGEQE